MFGTSALWSTAMYEGVDRLPLAANAAALGTPATSLQGPARNPLQKATKYLQDACCIGMCVRNYPRPRYVTLKADEMFKSLVTLYSMQLETQWQQCSTLVDKFHTHSAENPGWLYAARVLISHWFIDVYVANREAMMKSYPVSYTEHFRHKVDAQSSNYDYFLMQLHASLRPTNIKGVPENTLYIPIVSSSVAWTNEGNPFNIQDFILNRCLFHVILSMMKGWKMYSTTTDTVRRPFWLFDWHSKDTVCVWFPMEGNYTLEDICLAYIVGVACTPNLGPRDVDDWQDVTANSTFENFDRAEVRRFYGTYEVCTVEERTIDQDMQVVLDENKKWRLKSVISKVPSGSEPRRLDLSSEASLDIATRKLQFRLTDWTYYAGVFIQYDENSRYEAHCMMAFSLGQYVYGNVFPNLKAQMCCKGTVQVI